jgi:hypothetical protein
MDDSRRDPRATPTLRPQDVGSAATVSADDAPGHAPTIAVGSAGGATNPAARAAFAAPPGTRAMIGHFAIDERLGAGGMGEVYAGVDVHLGRPVAIKLVRSEVDGEAYRARLLREAQAMARLEHPNVVRVYEIGNDAGRLFVAMELVDGETLTGWLRAARAWVDVVAMFEQVGAGLAAVHAAGLVHRDFKPDNVLVDRAGRARVADFGLARLDARGTASPMAGALTQTGAVMGTPAYMAPEQRVGDFVDARADQYSFCVALREALVAARAWDAAPALGALRAAVTRGLSYDAAERFATMTELLAALTAARGGYAGAVPVAVAPAAAVASQPSSLAAVAPPTEQTAPSRNRGLVAAVIGLTAVAAAATAVAVVRDPPASPAQPPSLPPAPAPIIAELPRDAGAAAVADAATSPDAAVVAAVVPRDAAPPTRAHRDAAPADAAVATAVATGMPPLTPPTVQDTKLPAADLADPGHRGVVRDTIRDLGYDLVDAAALDPAALAAAHDHATGRDQLLAGVRLGLAERRRGDCSAAQTLLVAATTGIPWNGDPDSPWNARAWFSLGLCALAAGDLKTARADVNKAWVSGDQPEISLVLAVLTYEDNNLPVAHALFISASHHSDARVQAALQRWLAGTGLKL